MKTVTLHEDLTKRVLQEIASLPYLHNGGKVILTLELSCGSGGVFKEMEVKSFVSEKVRV